MLGTPWPGASRLLSFPLILFCCIILVKAFSSLTSGSSFGKHREAGLVELFLLKVESSALEPGWVPFCTALSEHHPSVLEP